jgi:hypothetical protein
MSWNEVSRDQAPPLPSQDRPTLVLEQWNHVVAEQQHHNEWPDQNRRDD